MFKSLPLFYFPTTICWLDDDKLFLEAADNLFKEKFNSIFFDNPHKAYKFLSSYETSLPKNNFIKSLSENDIYDKQDHYPVDINIGKISQLSEKPHRRDEISILIIDNNMPDIKGIDICRQLSGSPYKKILLTGETEANEIINAFNQGIIDKFVSKDQDIIDNLQKCIVELNNKFFYSQTENLLPDIETSKLTPLADPIFIDFFYNWCNSNKIEEFYLINKNGSFLVKDKNGNKTYFIVMSEKAIKDFIKLNDDALDKAGKMLEEISIGNKIPFFGVRKESWEFDYAEWEKYLYPAQIIEGREMYYWATIQNGNN